LYWLEVAVATDGEAAEAVSELLQPYAHNGGVILEQLGDPEDLDPQALLPTVTVKVFIPEDEDSPALRRRIEEALYHMGRLYPIPAPRFRQLEETDWANAWKDNYKPFRVGRRLWVQPSWLPADETQPDDIILTLDPGMAFGTGLHPSTQMCLLAVEELVRPGWRVLDVGTGSGILALAAASLGAAAVIALDTDRLAVRATRDNVELNHLSEQVGVFQGTLAALKPAGWDLVLVNILAPVIMSLLREQRLLDYAAEDGRLVLSGIIDEQGAEVTDAVARVGGTIERTYDMGDWVAFVVSKNATARGVVASHSESYQ
jgi:ribosomal protein L11 methyltransferase